MSSAPTISIVLPVHNEAENLCRLLADIAAVFDATVRLPCEIIVVDDASSDRSLAEVAGFKEAAIRSSGAGYLSEISIISLTTREGQASALMRGLRAARGELIVTMDADRQYDPADIPWLLQELAQCDMVCGVRQNRSDGIARLLCSRLANRFRNLITGDTLRDSGCVFRIMRRRCLAAILPIEGLLYGCDFFFHPLFVRKAGFRVVEAAVAHAQRIGGHSNYRLMRGRFVHGVAACFRARRMALES